MRRELSRKLIHLATVAVPLFVWWAPRPLAVVLLGLLAALAIAIELARTHSRWARYRFLRLTRGLLRHHERSGLSGATYMVVAFFLATLIFPRTIAVAAMLYNGLGDTAAALVGRKLGRHRTRWGKSWEGAAAALLTNLAIGLLLPGLAPAAVVIGAVAGAAMEFAPLPLDDNLRITLGAGLALWLVA